MLRLYMNNIAKLLRIAEEPISLKDSMFFRYFEQRNSAKLYEDENGFVLYKVKDTMLCILDVYTEGPKGHLAEMVNTVATLDGTEDCTVMEGYVDVDGNHSERITDLMLKYGFRYHKLTDDYIYMRKEL